MRGDFSQLYEDDPNLIGVLHQQGRVIRDADLNEQTLRLWHMIRDLAKDFEALETRTLGDIDFAANPVRIPAGTLYVDGIRVQVPKQELQRDARSLPFDTRVGEQRDDLKFDVYLEVQSLAAGVIQNQRYFDAALRSGSMSGLRFVTKSRLRVGPAIPEKITIPALTFVAKQDFGNRTYRFELYERDNVRKLKWSDNNASTLHTVSLLPENRPHDDVDPESDTPFIARGVERVQLLGYPDQTLTSTPLIEFLRPASTSFRSNHEPFPVQIADIDSDGIVTLAEPVDIELDVHDRAKGDRDTIYASFVVWRGELAYPDNDGAVRVENGIEIRIQPVAVDSRHGLSWTVDVRDGDSAEKELTAVAHQSRYLKRLGRIAVPEVVAEQRNVRRGSPTAMASTDSDEESSDLPRPDSTATTLAVPSIPLQRLELAMTSPQLRHWAQSTDLNEVAFLSVDDLSAKVLLAVDVPDEDRAAFDADVRLFVGQIDRFVKQFRNSTRELASA